MVQSNFESKIKIQEIIDNQIPEFVLEENPKFSEFLRQYYISQEYQGGNIDIIENLSEYIKLDNLTPDVISGNIKLSQDIDSTSDTIYVNTTKGFPNSYGLIQIDDEIITYESKLEDRFIGCIRGFSGINSYDNELVFSSTVASSHLNDTSVKNLSVLFLQKFYEKIKFTFLPGLEKTNLYDQLNVNNFIKNSNSFYKAKGSKESFRILFNALYGIDLSIVDLEQFLFKTSSSSYRRRKELLFENLSPDKNPLLLSGYQITKSNNSSVFGSVSEVEIFTRNNKVFYKFYIFLGYDDSNRENSGSFTVTPSTKVVEKILSSDNSNVITVDSTIGFKNSGSVFCNGVEIFYTEKSINQFFGCYTENKNFIDVDIEKTTVLYSEDIYYGYENNDKSKKINLRLLGVVNDLKISDENNSEYIFLEGENIFIKEIGNSIKNPASNKKPSEIIANSLIYNTSSRYLLSSFQTNSSTAFTLSRIEDSSLKVGDYVEFLERNTEILVDSLSNVLVTLIDKEVGEIRFNSNLNALNSLKEYEIRRKIKTSSSSLVPLKYDNITCDVSNFYSEDDTNFYIASNSLPSYEITNNILTYNASSLENFDIAESKYTSIRFNTEISFLSGDRVYYSYSDLPITGLNEGYYYVTVSSDNKEIKLFTSNSFIDVDKFEYLEDIPSGTHTFTLGEQKTPDEKIYPQKLFKKINSNIDIFYPDKHELQSEAIGILANGVEISSPNTNDKIYYGPLESIEVINSGQDYDVINPPNLEISYGNAKVQPVVQGSIQKVYVDPQDFNIERPIKLSISGGNGKNAVLLPVTRLKNREVFFDARIIEEGGGLSITSETISFLTQHNFVDGQKVIYDINNINNQKIGIGPFQGSDSDSGYYLGNNSIFYAKIINDRTIQLYPTYGDYISGINTVGFTTVGNFGIHKFKTEPKKVLDSIKVVDGGEGFTNRKLIVKQSGISTYNHTINFINHGFSSGELITYDYETNPVSGLSTSNQYYVLKVDNDSFRVCNAGVGGTDNQNYQRENYVKFSSTGSGYQYFNYPNITIDVLYTLAEGQVIKSIKATPVVKGSIVQAYLYESGSDYGSDIVNLEKSPDIKVLQGEFAKLIPVISSGKIVDVFVSYYGSNYYSVPDIVVESSSGVGAILKANILNGRLESVTIIEGGYGYNSDDTNIKVISTGKNSLFLPKIRSLTIDRCYKYGTQYQNFRDPSYEILHKTRSNTLQYTVSGYSDSIKQLFNETETSHSSIIGWSYDGIPIYGPFGYSDPNDSGSPIKLLNSGYTLFEVENRVSTSEFPLGYFIDDYKFTDSGDLDEYNGRFCITPEYPNGVYAYFATTKLNPNGQYVGVFPYFIGKYYRSKVIEENFDPTFNQSFNFNDSNLLRNTYPYKLGDEYGNNDFIPNYFGQICAVEDTNSGKIESVSIINSGNNYKVNDILNFDNGGSSGYGLQCSVKSLKGKDIDNIQTVANFYENAKIYKNSINEFYIKYLPNYNLKNNLIVSVTGLTSSFEFINGLHDVVIDEFSTRLVNNIPFGSVGIVTDIYLQNFPNRVSIGSSIKILGESYDQYFKILNYFDDIGALRVERTVTSGLSTSNSTVSFLPDVIKIKSEDNSVLTNPENYLRYFNPNYSIGIGTWSGDFTTKTFYNGQKSITIPIPTQSIYLPNHGFKTNQKVILRRPTGTTGINVSNDEGNTTFQLLSGATLQEELYIINKSKDYIGIATSVDASSTTNGLYFTGVVGSDNFTYSFESIFDEVLCNVSNVTSIVSISTAHELSNNDIINLTVKPNKTVGVGGSTSVNLRYNKDIKSITTKLITFTPSEVNLTNSKINLTDHKLKSGDKVYYISTSVIGGLNTGSYYIHKLDSNNINLCETYIDSILSPPNIITFNSVGIGTQELNLIQPRINVIKNNDLVFNLSDSSLNGYKFKLYTNKNFTKEFVSVASTNEFSIVGVNTIGLSTDASVTLKYSENYPETLYYTLEKDDDVVQIDDNVKNSLEIKFIDSAYDANYQIFDVTETQFSINVNDIPEELSYTSDECDVLSYTTSSLDASGPVNEVSIVDSGSDYLDIPSYINSSSSNGSGLQIVPSSTTVGKLDSISIKNSGFEYASDKTLSPKANISKNVTINSSNRIIKVDVLDGGKKYPSAPDLDVVDSFTGQKIDRGLLKANMSGGGLGNSNIESVSIEVPVNGLPEATVLVKSVNNSNGLIIDRVESSTVGILTCLIKTPILGFPNDPLSIGDRVFVENIEIVPGSGIGFDSKIHGYQFFDVIDYTPSSNPGRVVIKIPKLYGNPGIAVTFQLNTFPSMIDENNYPIFSVQQDYSLFETGEGIAVLLNDQSVIVTDLKVETARKNYLKITGEYQLKTGDIIKGFSSGFLATVQDIKTSDGVFIIGGELEKSLDWEDETGKISNDSQFLPDNDYYQNLSYTIKSEKTWNEISSMVNSMVHPIGTKNFADTQVLSSSSVGIGSTRNSILDSIQSFITQSRVDTIKNLDFVKDYDVNANKSRIIRFKNLRLTNYTESLSNRVLQIDDISDEFSSSDDNDQRLNKIILALPKDQSYGRFIVQIKSTDENLVENGINQVQFSEFISLKNDDSAIFLEKNTLTNQYEIVSDSNVFGEKIADITFAVDEVRNYYMLFTPIDPYNIDYEIKILADRFITTLDSESSFTIGSSDIFNDVSVVSPNDSVDILSLDSATYSSFYSQIHVLNKNTFEMNYVEIYSIYDGTNIYYSDYYFNGNDEDNFSYGFIGSFGLSVDGGVIKLNYLNENLSDSIVVRSKNICFNDNETGIGTYRFKSTRQDDGSERTLIIDSGTEVVSSSSTIFSYDSELFSSIKSLVKVSVGNTHTLHQLMVIHDDVNSIITEYPILEIPETSGIGTFGSFVDQNNFETIFTPNSEFLGESITIQYYNEVFYTFFDEINLPNSLSQPPLFEYFSIARYFGINSKNIDRLNFKLLYNNIPIFAKTFDPYDTNILNPSSGVFTIDNHFFSTGEKLIYKPKSSFIGLGQSALGIPSGSITDAGISTDRLPSSVYAIKLSNSQFKIALTEQNANSGIGVVFTDLGEGNAHMFEMYKKNEKTLITINNLAQYPLTYTGIAHSLFGNDGQIGVGNTFFTLSGISSIKPNDLLKIDDEYMKVINVGIGTSNTGPILFFTGDKNIVEVERGFVGTSATSHLDDSQVNLYRGSYNVYEDQIYFTQPPRGSIFDLVQFDERNLARSRSKFTGRVFLRRNYTTNVIFDDISPEFTGIGQTFILKSQGINTVGLGTTSGNGILFINGIYQTPFTENITNFNFQIVEDPILGISSIVFSGIRNDVDEIAISESDVNQNQLPRGGLIVSLGSTAGLGYAPLVGAKVRAKLDSNGSITEVVGVATTGSSIAFTTALYNNESGILRVFSPSLSNLEGVNQVKIIGMGFTCPSNPGIISYFPSREESLNIIGVGTTSFSVQVGTSTLPHYYVGYGTIYPWYEELNFGSGYREPISVGITETGHVGDTAIITADVGAGGTLSFNIGAGGTGYINPIIQISPPNYQNLPIIGVSRLGIGETTDTGIGLLMNVEIGPSVGIDTLGSVGIGSTLYEVSAFKITRPGYNFKRGDIFKPIGLVTAKGLSEPIEEFKLAVLDTYNDNFASWQFGEMDLIDSIKPYQNGSRLNYPLFYNGELLSFQTNIDDPDSQVIDYNSLLVIFINGVLQEPGFAYEFNGGSAVRFLTAPKINDNVEIYFYLGSRGEDSRIVEVDKILQVGDIVQVYSNNSNLTNTVTQDRRLVFDFLSSDLMETNLYSEQGIDEENEKPLYWTKQKEDIIVNDIVYSKSRDSLEPQIYPTAKIIKDFSEADTEIFVDNASFFDYEEELPTEKFNLMILPSDQSVEVGIVTAVVSTSGTIQFLSIVNSGFGYTGSSSEIKISNPYYGIGVGVGTTATASLTISNGSISSVSIINPGFGYTYTNPPQVLINNPEIKFEECSDANVVIGFDGVIVGIKTTDGIGTDLALEFELFRTGEVYTDLSVGYPIYIYDTQVGTGLTTIDSVENDTIGLSTSFLDNVYYIHGVNTITGIITCNISNTTNIVGVATTGTKESPVGKFSWGKISGFSRSSSPISIGVSEYTVNSGLSSYPSIQRRGYGLRKTGALKKDLKT